MDLDNFQPGDRLIAAGHLYSQRDRWINDYVRVPVRQEVPSGEVITYCGYQAGPGSDRLPMPTFKYRKFEGYLEIGPEYELERIGKVITIKRHSQSKADRLW